MNGGLIFNRSPNLVLAFLIAVYNVAAVGHVAGFTPTAELTAVINIFLAAVVALIAGNDTIQISSGNAARGREQ